MRTLITAQGVSSNRVDTNAAVISQHLISEISNNPTLNNGAALPTSVALYIAVMRLKEDIASLATNPDGQLSVFSQSYVSSVWDKVSVDQSLGWVMTSQYVRIGNDLVLNGAAVQPPNVVNYVETPLGRLIYQGNYFFTVRVAELSGEVELYINDSLYGTITQGGNHSFLIPINNPSNTKIKLVCKNLVSGNRTVLANPYLILVNERLQDFVGYIAQLLIEASTNDYITTAQLNAAIQSLQADITTALDVHENEANPHPQYLLRTEASETLIPNTIVDTPKGISPIPSFSNPPLLTRHRFLSHGLNGPYDPNSGFISSTVKPITDLHEMVVLNTATSQRMTMFSAVGERPEITYQMIEVRPFTSVSLFFDKVGSTAYITSITVRVGGFSETINVIPYRTNANGNPFTIDIPVTVTTNSIYIKVEAVTGNGQFSLGFGAVFTQSSDIEIRAGIQMVAGTLTGPLSYSTTSPVSIDTSSMVLNHPYAVSLKPSSQAELFLHKPICTSKSDTSTYPLRTLNTSDIYGTVSQLGITESSRKKLYARLESVNVTNMTINHSFTQPFLISKIALEIELSEVDLLDKTISITATSQTNSHVFTLVSNAHPLTRKSISSNTLQISADNLQTLGPLVSYSIQINSASPAPLHGVDVSFVNVFYNKVTKAWSDNQPRVILGTLTKVNTSGYIFSPAAINKTATIYVNGLNAINMLTTTSINNPLYSSEVSVDSNTAIFKASYNASSLDLVFAEASSDIVLTVKEL